MTSTDGTVDGPRLPGDLETAITPVVVADPTALAEAAARWTAEWIGRAIGDRGACYLALAGGETPRGCYRRLAQPPYDRAVRWNRLFVYWSDERRVPLDDPASNYAMARAALLDHVPVPADQVFPLTEESLPALPHSGKGLVSTLNAHRSTTRRNSAGRSAAPSGPDRLRRGVEETPNAEPRPPHEAPDTEPCARGPASFRRERPRPS